ncbi:glycosyltransferase [Rubellimicrobium aerolatum]|uniref:Glycosyltransferase n=1 Tax=Rubellimicrobium aerolatum TaxID=490979 RepID=A0ABW0S9T6_9RHOB|nr:glycosyltransferase [Rubellimicrobium aerolatum]MBP1805041.1 lipopolysaccharide biosynthesis glycosyltransferase [Rubellimicrobium aerolatum]
MNDKLKIYIGYDTREDIAYQVCRHSILRHASRPVEIYPLKQASLRELGLYTRGADNATTEFSLTRFLTPYLAAHDGWSIFVDCDFLFTRDVYEALDIVDPSKAVHVVQHDYSPANAIKMDNKQQTVYPRKNWSSFILFNGTHPDVKALTPSVVNAAEPAFLHRFTWVSDDSMIGSLPLEWNFLEGEYRKPDAVPMAIHYTNGGPWFDNWQHVDFADLWTAERDLVTQTMTEAA